MLRDTFCSYCGTRYAEPLHYPRTCTGCATQVWANPIPVAVVLVQLVFPPAGARASGGSPPGAPRTGLLVVRRAIPPQIGKLALVGGFLEEHESWQQGGAREVREETGGVVDPATLEPFWYASSDPRPNRVMLFALAPPMPIGTLPSFEGHDHESSERGAIFGPGGLDEVFAFSTHIEAARRYFAQRGVSGDHAFVAC